MFEVGFLGTRAPFYMDLVTSFFAFLPFFVGYSISFAIRGDIKKHYLSQIAIFVATILIVVVFEVGVRFSGGFLEFIKDSAINVTFLSIFLIIHIIIAIATVVLWVIQLYSGAHHLKNDDLQNEYFKRHKRLGKLLFGGIITTSVMGCCIYIFLFVF